MYKTKPVPLIKCDDCGGTLIPVKFVEEERDKHNILTGRKRMSVSHLECDLCCDSTTVDDSFDGPWQ